MEELQYEVASKRKRGRLKRTWRRASGGGNWIEEDAFDRARWLECVKAIAMR